MLNFSASIGCLIAFLQLRGRVHYFFPCFQWVLLSFIFLLIFCVYKVCLQVIDSPRSGAESCNDVNESYFHSPYHHFPFLELLCFSITEFMHISLLFFSCYPDAIYVMLDFLKSYEDVSWGVRPCLYYAVHPSLISLQNVIIP